MSNRMAVIMAAGKGTRMKSSLYKVLHPICGLPMVEYVKRATQESGVKDIVAVVGHGAEAVREALGNSVHYALQEEQLGTGHAVQQAAEQLEGRSGHTLVICGDTPLITGDTLNKLFEVHESSGSKATVLTAIAEDSTGYGRIVRNAQGHVKRIVEETDATDEERQIKEINTGTFVFDNEALFKSLKNITNGNAQGEYYLTDVLGLLEEAGETVSAYAMDNFEDAIGINDRIALAEATRLMRARIARRHMMNGVTFVNPAATQIEADVTIGQDTVIETGVSLKGNTTIGKNCFIGVNSEIYASEIADNVSITQSTIEESFIDENTGVGPYTHVRPASTIGKNVNIGNFVEIKNSILGDNTKSAHLTYIGDATIGRNVNIGSGTIFVNYDGVNKHRAIVGDDSFIGCNSNILSPVTVGDRSFIAAGTTLTDDVPDEALAISRTDQINIAKYWQKLQKK